MLRLHPHTGKLTELSIKQRDQQTKYMVDQAIRNTPKQDNKENKVKPKI